MFRHQLAVEGGLEGAEGLDRPGKAPGREPGVHGVRR